MEKVINSYESLFIVDVTKGDEVTEATVNKFVSMIEANAEIVDIAKWGKRRLAYPINDMPEGYYVIVTFKSAPEFIYELERK
ncbi:MAG: 30S ribosomal protein S6, partial [Clostridia bacterium]|nr:30S ribosomal protein S6 [Clostridia bacterium]